MGDEDASLVDEYERAVDEQSFLRRIYDGHFLKDNATDEEFCVRSSCEGCPFEEDCDHDDFEKKRFLSVDASIRRAIRARDEHAIVAIDYSGLELRTAANLSGEPKWIREFYRCGNCDTEFDELRENQETPPRFCPECGEDDIGDLHTLTAKLIWGEEVTEKPDFKLYRQKAKSVNFAILYGGGARRIGEIMDANERKGQSIKDKVLGGLSKLQSWMDRQVNKAYNQGEVETRAGRKIRFHNGGEYKAVNSVVQGTATGDLTRMAMVLVYKGLKKHGDLEDCRIFGSMHDEIVFEVRKDRLDDLIPFLRKMMTYPATKFWNFTVPLQVDVEVGDTWDVHSDWDAMHYVPDGEDRAKEPVPSFLRDYIEMEPGMYYEGESPKREDGDETSSQGDAEDEGNDNDAIQEDTSEPDHDIVTEREGSDSDNNDDDDSGEIPDLPTYTYQTDRAVNTKTAQKYMMQLTRILDWFRHCYGGGGYLLEVRDRRDNVIFGPDYDVVEVNPEIFEVLASYEGI
jgi:predicted nucleic acid-binding Zn ribbon protein